LAASHRAGKKGKGREMLKKGDTQSLKSKEVQRIERLINSLHNNQPSPWTGKEACFCKGIQGVYMSLASHIDLVESSDP